MITRAEFIDYWNKLEPRFKADELDSPLWIPEHDMSEQCQWFVCVKPDIIGRNGMKPEYWSWCGENLKGVTRCFSSNHDDDEEWWGFTNKDDVVFWMLRWAQ